jgi:hypothetical protein
MHAKRKWEPITLRYEGNVGAALRGGGGKLSPTTGDTGEARKVPSTG